MQGFQSDFGPMGAGPSISGKWYNKRTGKTVIVRDSFFMDDGMQVQTSTGEFIDGQEFSRDYIQCGDEIYDESGRITESSSPIDYDALFNTPQQTDVQLELNNTINNTINIIPEEVIVSTPKQIEPIIPEENKVLDRFFNKFKTVPSIQYNIDWKEIPVTELNIMQSIFDISIDDISEYIANRYCSLENIKEGIKQNISKMLNPQPIEKEDNLEQSILDNSDIIEITPQEEIYIDELQKSVEESLKPKKTKRTKKSNV